uniref:mitogen-activated protein kinase kinase kinase 18-like n=1 Tax=Erigeron canadensis TaxID=72917 RepID=UPI001CB93625|nr:mitogen-activated protein kinase kinase kinase 18-like [Erigeron canadensis]
MYNSNSDHKPNWVRKSCIGRGSFGTVSLAVVDEVKDAMFAVKSVDKKKNTDFVKCLESEIRILKSLSCPYVVTYLGDDETCEKSTVYRNLHMEYMSGGTVADVAKEMDIEDVRSYTRCITSALSYIHRKNIVHCDVKGKNVLIGKVPGVAKLADFGSAIELGGSWEGTRGSPLWMAPEVIRGEYQGPESDVWSLGCTVIEMITGKPAWQDRGADTLRQIGYSDDLPILELENSAPIYNDLIDFVYNCLKREQNERWSCDQLLHHPFLLSCSTPSPTPIKKFEFSPRCVFDWSDSSSSNESTTFEINNLDINYSSSKAKQRICQLASTSGVIWESEGWEVVRHVTITATLENLEQTETTSEYVDSILEEASVSGRANWEFGESNDCYSNDNESTNNDARSTIVGWMYRYIDHLYRCYMFVINKKSYFCLICMFAQRFYSMPWLYFNVKFFFFRIKYILYAYFMW